MGSAILCIGSSRCRLDKRDKRCVVVNVDPVTLGSNPDVLGAIAKEREAHFGMYGTPVEPGGKSQWGILYFLKNRGRLRELEPAGVGWAGEAHPVKFK